MLSEEEAWAIVNELPPCRFQVEATDGDVIAPVASSLRYYVVTHDRRNCWSCRETLILWHALASCPGYSAAENPSFWMRTLRSVAGADLSHPSGSFDRARFFPDPQRHPFPSVTLQFAGGYRRDVLKSRQRQAQYQHLAEYLTRVIDADNEPRSDVLCAALERLQGYIDPVCFSRPIPVHLQCTTPFFRLINGTDDHYVRTWAVSAFVATIHEWLVQLPAECTTMGSDKSSAAAGFHTGAVVGPRFVIKTVDFVNLHDIRVATTRELQLLMEDPRLEHVAFPRLRLVKIHQSMRPKTVRRFLTYFLRPLNALRLREPCPRLPHSLTLQVTNDGTDDGVGAHVELFFQLLPFTQSIQSLTLVGMDDRCHWGWLGYALFHPSAQSSLRKLSISTSNYELAPTTLSLYVKALQLRASSVSEFKAVIMDMMSSQAEKLQCEDVDVSALPVTHIDHVTIDVSMASTDPEWRHHDKHIYDLSQWAIVVMSLALSVQCIHVKPLHQFKPAS